MLKHHPLCFILIGLLFIYCLSSIPSNYTRTSISTIIPNIHDLGYSHDQRLLVVIQQGLQGGFYVYDGLRLMNQKKIQVKDQLKLSASPSVFAFTHDDSLLLIGTQQGSLFGYKILNQIVSQSWSYNISFGSKDQVFTVRSISIDANDNIVVAIKEKIYVLGVPQGIREEEATAEFISKGYFEFKHLVQTASWLQENVVIVGAFGGVNGNFSLVYTNNKTQKSINYDKTLTISVSTDGKTIYKSTVDKNIEVYAYQSGDVPKLVTTILESNSPTKIQVSKDGKLVAAVVRGGRVKSWRVGEEVETNLKTEIQEQKQNFGLSFGLNLDEEGKNLALSQIANDLLVIPTTDTSQLSHFTLCLTSTYLSPQQSDCLPCSPNCATCFTQQTCISCTNDKFIDGDTCSKCNTKLDGCLTCESGDKCITCDQDADWNKQAVDGKCQCKETYYEKEGKCKECGVFLDCYTCDREDYCNKCKDEGNFDTQPVDGKCQCKQSFWLNLTECIQCSTAIKDCIDCTQDGKQCHQCQSPTRRPSSDQTKCQCIDHYYEDTTDGSCQLCDLYQTCLQCSPQDPHTCTKCDTSKNRKQSPEDGKCVCKDGYYDDQKGGCLECDQAIVDCFTCENENKCLSCKNESNFSPDPVGGKCVCVEGWILDREVCKLCGDEIVGCKTCKSVSKCDTCNEELHFIEAPTAEGKCVCMSKYWLDGKLCDLCSNKTKGCDTCSEDGSKCFSCQDPNRSPNQAGTSCDCKQYFYEDTNQVCQLCDQKESCLRCNQTDPAHKCFSCDSNKHWNATPSDGVCKCMTGYNQYDGKCILCTVPGCVQCHTQTTCTRCDPSKQFNPQADHNTCTCIAGTYQSQDKQSCLNCSSSILGCKQCSNANDCNLCDDSKHFTQNPITNQCDCMKSYYLKNNQSCEQCNLKITKCVECLTMGTQVQCTACEKGWGTSGNRKDCVDCGKLSVGCVDCSDGGHCLKCDGDKGFVLRDNVCVCKEGLYQKNGSCLECTQPIPGCIACTSQAQCTNCTNQNHFSPLPDTNKRCSCISGWTLNNKECQACSIITGCLQCSNINTCTKCDDQHFFQPTKDQTCQCKQSYWLNVTECQQCSTTIYDCKFCSQDGKQCSECLDPNRQVKKDGTVCECKKFTYQDSDSKKCQLCDEYKNCVQCSPQGDHQCLVCDIQKFWNQKPTPSGQCTCQSSYTQFNHSCIECKVTGCSQCQQANTCYECSKDNKFKPLPVDGKCQCQPQTLIDDGKCYYCSQKIVGCMECENFSECEKCAEEGFFVLDNETKRCKCDPSHYLVQTLCKNCSQGIKYCQQCVITQITKQCTKCKKGFQPSEDQKTCLNCQDLIIGCADCVDMEHCQQCDGEGHFVFSQDKTKCVCDKGYFLKENGCEECGKEITGCQVCSENGQECSQCNGQEHFELNNDTKKCICVNGYFLTNNSCANCSTLLPGCSSCSSNGSECLTCQSGYFLSQGKCSLCSSTIPGCTQCSSDGNKCSKCNTDDKFIFNDKTQKCDCIATYFLNVSQCFLCDTKFIGCSLCDVNECQQCTPQHFVYNNQSKQCICQQKYYLNTTQRTCKLCQQAIAGCVLCSKDGDKCGQCNGTQQFILDNTTSKCLCKDGYFEQQRLCSMCSSLYPGCTNCSQPNNICSSCNTNNNFVYNQKIKLCVCKQLYYIASSTECNLCSSAITYCQSCQSTQGNYTPSCIKCKDGFELSQTKLSCTCPGNDKEIVDGQCVDKQKINWVLYGAIGGGVLLLVVVGVVVYLKWKKAKSRVSLQEEEFDDSETNGKRRKQETLLTSDNNSNLLKSSGSLDIDE